jgi:hypothetical protein
VCSVCVLVASCQYAAQCCSRCFRFFALAFHPYNSFCFLSAPLSTVTAITRRIDTCGHQLQVKTHCHPAMCRPTVPPFHSPGLRLQLLQLPWDGLQLSHARVRSGSNPGLPRTTSRLFRTSSWAGCVLDFWWSLLCELHVYFSMWSEAEALSEYGVVPE